VIDRRPFAPMLSRTAERREIRRTFRLAHAEDLALREGAVAERADFSAYCRECLLIGHSMKQAQRLTAGTRA